MGWPTAATTASIFRSEVISRVPKLDGRSRTGTPEPGGLDWFQTIQCLEQIVRNKIVIGYDFVELAPIEKFHAPDFLVARLIYNFMGLIVRK